MIQSKFYWQKRITSNGDSPLKWRQLEENQVANYVKEAFTDTAGVTEFVLTTRRGDKIVYRDTSPLQWAINGIVQDTPVPQIYCELYDRLQAEVSVRFNKEIVTVFEKE